MYGNFNNNFGQNAFMGQVAQQMQGSQMPGMGAAQQGMQLNKVNGIGGASAFWLPPNSMAPLFDTNDDILYLKYTDSGGFASMRTFRLTEVTGNQAAPQYVTRQEFEQLKGMILNAQHDLPAPGTAEPNAGDSATVPAVPTVCKPEHDSGSGTKHH